MKLNQNNWQKIEFGKFAHLGKQKYQPSAKESLPCVELECIEKETGIISHTLCSSELASTKNRFTKGSVLFGKLRPYLRKYAMPNFDGVCTSEIWVLQPDVSICIPDFLFLLVQSEKFIYTANISCGTRMPRAEWDLIENLPLIVPPLSEQHRIVAVLETWDKAISLTKRLIEQKEIQKKHLMRQLLTGKTRLKGFSGKWEKHILSDFTCRITRRNTENNKNIVTISAKFGFIPQTNFFTKNVASSSVENYFLIYKNEFCYNKSYSLGYPSGTIKRLKDFEKSVVTPLYICFAIKDNKHLDYVFFEQYCETGLFNRYLDKIANEGGRAHGLLNVSVNDFFKLPLNVPSIKEQQAIAEILSAADRDISLLKEKLAKLQQQKKGLMQILLTGKVRLTI